MSEFGKITRVLSPPPAPVGGSAEEDWLDPQALFRVVRRRIWLILCVGVLIMAALVPMILGMERKYTAAARVLIHAPLPAELVTSGVISGPDMNPTVEVERLVSRGLALHVISDLGLDRLPEFNPALRDETIPAKAKQQLKRLLSGDQTGQGAVPDEMELVVRSFSAGLGIARTSGSDMVSLSFTSRDAQLAALVPNTLIQAYLEDGQLRAVERIARASTWVEGRIAEQTARLENASVAADAARASSDQVATGAPGAMQTLSDLSERRAAIVRRRAELSTQAAAFAEAGDLQERARAADTESVFMLMRQLDTEQAELDRLLRRYGSAQTGAVAEDMRNAAETRIAGLERSIEAEAERARRNILAELEALEREEATILVELAAAEQSLADANQLKARLDHLQRVVNVEQDALDVLDRQLLALRAEASLPAAEVEILSPATVPPRADGRGRLFYLAGAFVAAGMAALTVAFAREMSDRTVRSHEQLRKIARIVPSGLVPAVSARALGKPRTRRQRRDSQLYRDSIEGLILALEQGGRGGLPLSIVVTSALPREGKSAIALGIASELAASGSDVLLVDADLRNGRVHERFAVRPGPGLGDYLAGNVALEDVIRRDDASGLSFITRGGNSGTKRHMEQQRLKTLIASANARQQFVIFDAAPALVANEALALTGLSVRTVLVVEWGRTTREAVEAAAERLTQRSGYDLDVVINRVNLRRQALYSYPDGGEQARVLRRYHAA